MAKRYRLKMVLIAIALMSVLTVAVFPVCVGLYMWCDWVPDATLARLPNASKVEVRQLLGEPDYPSENQDQAKSWSYRRQWRLAEFQVHFGPDGRVEAWYYDR
jgi:hypothetical protein